MARGAVRLTKTVVERMQPGDLIWDSEVKGFGVRRQKTAKVFVFKFTVDGKGKWKTIGEFGQPFTVDLARQEAHKLKGEVAKGEVPDNRRAAAAKRRREELGNPTLSEFATTYLEKHARLHKGERSAAGDECNLNNHIVPLLGSIRVKDITREDVEGMKLDIAAGKTAPKNAAEIRKGQRGGKVAKGGKIPANRCLALLSKMMSLAEAWNIRPLGSNPVRGVARFKEEARQRFLASDEIAKLAKALDAEEPNAPYAVAALKLLLMTGARKEEILSMRWDEIDLESGTVTFPRAKRGKRHAFLSAAAIDVLNALPRIEGNPHVIVGERAGSRIVNINRVKNRVMEAAGLGHVRIHDLRHSFASMAGREGYSEPEIGALLGHTNTSTTKRYIQFVDKHIKDVGDRVGNRIGNLLRSSG